MAQPKTILLADDDEYVRFSLARILNDIGYRTFEAEDGLKALEMMHQNDIDIVLLDYRMPGLDGDRVAREMVKRDMKAPIILVTGLDNIKELAQKTGTDLFLEKPLNLAMLREALQKAETRLRPS